jgi:hypothetical protein
MTYNIYADGVELSDFIKANLKRKLNEFDYLEFTLKANHPQSSSILNKKTIIVLKTDGVIRFIGKVAVKTYDIFNQCTFECDSIASRLKETFFTPVPTKLNDPLNPYSFAESLELIETAHNAQETNENLKLGLSYDLYDTKPWYANISFADALIQAGLDDMFGYSGIFDRKYDEFNVVDEWKNNTYTVKNYFVSGEGTGKIYGIISTDFSTLNSYVYVYVNGGAGQKLWMGDNRIQLSIGENTLQFDVPIWIGESARDLTRKVCYRDEPFVEWFNRKEYQTCWNALISQNENNPQIFQRYSLYTLFNFVIRYTDTKIYLDFYNNKSVIPTLNQSITMENLFSITKTLDASTMVNTIVPLGATYEELGISGGGDKRLNLLDDPSHTVPYVEDATLVATFGRITDVVTFDGIKKAVADDDSDSNLLDNLEDLGNEELANRLNENITIELEAIDMSLINPDYDQFDIGRKVTVNLPLYGINNLTLMIDEIEWDLLNPSTNKLTLGTTIKSLTEQIRDSK